VDALDTQGAYIADSLSITEPRRGLQPHQAGLEALLMAVMAVMAVVRECVTSGVAGCCTESATHGVQGADSRGVKGRRKDYYWNRQAW